MTCLFPLSLVILKPMSLLDGSDAIRRLDLLTYIKLWSFTSACFSKEALRTFDYDENSLL